VDEAEFTPLHPDAPVDLAGAEKALIAAVLQQHAGNRRHTAEQLGISERTLYRKLRRYGLG
jgi:DNA-binding NtrC family response regulator